MLGCAVPLAFQRCCQPHARSWREGPQAVERECARPSPVSQLRPGIRIIRINKNADNDCRRHELLSTARDRQPIPPVAPWRCWGQRSRVPQPHGRRQAHRAQRQCHGEAHGSQGRYHRRINITALTTSSPRLACDPVNVAAFGLLALVGQQARPLRPLGGSREQAISQRKDEGREDGRSTAPALQAHPARR